MLCIIWAKASKFDRFYRVTFRTSLRAAEELCAAREIEFPGSYYMIEVK